MSGLGAALWAEMLKARRSKVLPLTALGSLLLPAMAGFFMLILRDPERAKTMGLISTKAQILGNTADWPTYVDTMAQGTAIAGGILFAIITAWIFGREFSDHTASELLALPITREAIVGAKFVLVALWVGGLLLLLSLVALAVGLIVEIPGWSLELGWRGLRVLWVAALLDLMLMPIVAFVAGATRGYLAPLGWAFLTVLLAQVAGVIGWGDWFPWTVPALVGGAAGTQAAQLGVHSHLVVVAAGCIGIGATLIWWLRADQAE